MRIEDLDLQRVRPGAADQLLSMIRWLGLDFDDGPLWQSHDLEPYRRAMRKLTDLQLAYSCTLSRSQIRSATSAPHGEDRERRSSCELRPRDDARFHFQREDSNFRFKVEPGKVPIDDRFAGPPTHDPCEQVGDFIIWTKLAVPAYQLAVVVDDARQGITDVVRGDDLLPSAARQTLLYRALGLNPPQWWHIPLIHGEDGRRLAKRHGGTHLETYRKAGVTAERIIGLLAFWSGVSHSRRPMSAHEFRQQFEIKSLPRHPVTFTSEDHQWLMQGALVPC